MMCTAPELRRSQQSGQVLYGERQKREKKRNSTAFLFNVLAIAQKVEVGKKQQVKKEEGHRGGKRRKGENCVE